MERRRQVPDRETLLAARTDLPELWPGSRHEVAFEAIFAWRDDGHPIPS